MEIPINTVSRFLVLILVLAVVNFCPLALAQPGQPQRGGAAKDQKAAPYIDGWGSAITTEVSTAPAPRHDISGVWDPVGNRGVQQLGAGAMPEDGKPEHQLPYTPLGLEKLKLTKPSNGTRTVLPADSDDPAWHCDPQGLPREELFEFRTTQILQTPEKVLVLYEYGKIWRAIWTDGRELPKDPEPRWFGYSIGKWQDDYTFVVQSSGMDERTWVDRAGRPHSDALRLEERFHRVDHDHLELTVTIDDPKMYTKPWVALDKLRFNLEPPNFDVREMMCSPSELEEYNKLMGNPSSGKDSR
jgi:hypothetical protein